MQNTEFNKNLNLIISKLKEFPDLFELEMQNNQNVADYFNSKFDCLYLPQDFLDFMSVLNGLHTEIFTIFATYESENRIIMTFDNYSNEDKVNRYLSGFKMKTDSKLFFFAADNVGGRYAFKKDKQDDKVYYFDPSKLGLVFIYSSFFDLLYDKIEKYIAKKKNNL